MDVKTTKKAEQSEATRRTLVDVARAMFTEIGFAETATEAVVARAGVTRGALYHHFRDKTDLFRAVLEQVQEEIVETVQVAAAKERTAWGVLSAGCQAFLDACLDPGVVRIMLMDGPSVLGAEQWLAQEETCGLAMTRFGLAAAMEAGEIERRPIEPLAHMLLGALNEGARYLALAEDREVARVQAGDTVERLLEGLRTRKKRR